MDETSIVYMYHKYFHQLGRMVLCGVLIWNNLPPNLCGIDCGLSNFKTTFKRLYCWYCVIVVHFVCL